jgi:hypothetical protein
MSVPASVRLMLIQSYRGEGECQGGGFWRVGSDAAVGPPEGALRSRASGTGFAALRAPHAGNQSRWFLVAQPSLSRTRVLLRIGKPTRFVRPGRQLGAGQMLAMPRMTS